MLSADRAMSAKTLLIKTFVGVAGVNYTEGYNRPAVGHLILGFLLAIALPFVYPPSSLSVVFLALGGATAIIVTEFLWMRKLEQDIATAVNLGSEVCETRYSYNGERRFKNPYLLSPTSGIVVGIIVSHLLGWKYLNISDSSLIMYCCVGIGIGFLLGIGFKYLHMERKFKRRLMVARYKYR